jgi:colicin import membrane protein
MEIAVPPLTPAELPKPAARSSSDDPEKMTFGFRLSLGLHVGVALFVLIQGFIFPGKQVPYIPSLRVDLVGLPDQLKQDLTRPSAHPPAPAATPQAEKVEKAPPPAIPHPKAAPVPLEQAKPNEMVLNPVQAKQRADKKLEKKMSSSLARIKALAKISGEPVAKTQTDESAHLIKGNRISKGSSVSGEARESDKEDYIGALQSAIRENWELPLYLERQQLTAQVMIFIDATGRMTQYKFIRSSGVPQFDDAIKRALMKSQPFPMPPADISSTVESGVMVGFPL